MSRLFQHREGGRTELDELQSLLDRLNASDAQTRMAIGAGVYLANTEFIRRYGAMETFRRSPAEEQTAFVSMLSDLELSSRSHEPGMALGISLYRIWLTESLAGRREIAEPLGEELARLSRNAGK